MHFGEKVAQRSSYLQLSSCIYWYIRRILSPSCYWHNFVLFGMTMALVKKFSSSWWWNQQQCTLSLCSLPLGNTTQINYLNTTQVSQSGQTSTSQCFSLLICSLWSIPAAPLDLGFKSRVRSLAALHCSFSEANTHCKIHWNWFK